jgi:glycosyltransferase involved in cell wall biosynthesis
VAAGARRLAERWAPELVLAAGAELADLEDESLALLDDYALETARRTPAVLALPGGGPGEAAAPALVLLSAAAAGRLDAELGAPAEDAGGVEPAPGKAGAIGADDLAARARALDLAWLDLRVVRRLRENAVQPGAMPGEALERLSESFGAGPAEGTRLEPQFWLDETYVPETVRHGDRAPVVVRGWVVASPMPRRVLVRVDGHEALRADVSVRRADVLASHPWLEHEACGFDLRGEIGPLAPGTHDVEWVVDGTEMTRTLGNLRVLPVLRLELTRVVLPERVAPGARPPLLVEGRVVSSDPAPVIEARAGARPLRVRVRALPPAGEGRPGALEFVASGRLETPAGEGPTSFDLEVRSLDRSDSVTSKRRLEVTVEPGAGEIAFQLRRIGEFDPRLGGTPVALRGLVFDARASDRIELIAGEARLAEANLTPVDSADPALPVAVFALEREALAGLAAGEHELRLELVPESGGPRRTLARWRQEVGRRLARVRAGEARLEPLGEAGRSRLVLEGDLEPADLAHSLALAVDGVVRTRLGGEWLQPAEAGSGVEARFHRFRFDAEMALEPGVRALEIRVRRGAEESAAWSGSVTVPEPGSAPAARVRCAELDRLLREDPAPVWSRIVLEGEVVGSVPDATAVLRLGERRAAEARIGETGRFRLETRPEQGRLAQGRLEIEAGGRVLSRSPIFRAAVRPLRLPKGAVSDFAALAGRLLPGGLDALAAPAAEVLLRMLERAPGSSASLLAAISDLEARAREAERRPAAILEGERPLPDRRFSVLLACWEVPCSRHGGGVCMVNLLRHLGVRHDITLLHSLAPGEEGLSEQVRPHVREILTVRREWREHAEGAEFGVPRELARNESPRVREVIEAELATGVYDLVNYEFNPMVLHASGARVPSLGVLHEVHSFARTAVLPERFADAESAAAALSGVIESLHFETALAPRSFREVVTLTREEAEFLARWLPGARLFVSPIPVDVERFAAAAAAAHPEDAPPTFVFVGNYIHPPNREAACLLASRVAPAALAHRPDLRFVIAGPHPPDELRELARPPAIEVAGFVPDLEGLLSRATAFVAPIVSGGGLRVKLLEAMAGGCAVVSTPLGLNGIPAEPGREVVRVSSVDDFAGAVLRLAEDRGFARRIGGAGRALVERTFGITAQGERRERIWRAVLDAAPQR